MKKFIFDTLVDRDNICDLETERRALKTAVNRGAKIVLYGSRNHGKTSVVRNIVIEDFRKKHRRGFVFFADLLGVDSLESLAGRLGTGLERCFAESFPVKNLLENAGRFLGSLRPEISVDAQTGSPAVSLKTGGMAASDTVQTIWDHITAITRERPSLVVLDEFQDVALVNQGPQVMRGGLEALGDVPAVVMGSKRHMLSDLFARPDAPLGGWGSDLEFGAIPYESYHRYILERFEAGELTISPEAARVMQDMLQRVPEAINRVGQQILELFSKRDIGVPEIQAAVLETLRVRASRYESYMEPFSGTDRRVMIAAARRGTVEKPQSKAFIGEVGLTARTVGLSIRRLWNRGVLERDKAGWRIADPLLAAFLRLYR